MLSEKSWLFLKSSVFSYTNKIALLVLGFLHTYILANALGPENYGLAMFVLAFVGNLVYLFGVEVLGNTLVVFTPRYNSKKLFLRFLKILFVIFLMLSLTFFFFSQPIALILDKGNAPIYRSVAVLLFVFPFFLLFEALFRGLKSFGKVLKVSVFESFTNLCFAILFIIALNLSALGIIFAKIASLCLASILYLYFFKKRKFAERECNIQELKRYVKNIFAVSVLKKINMQIVLIYMGLFLSNTLLGLYYVAEKIASYAVEMPIAALSETMLPFASEKANNKNALSRLVSLSIKFSLISGILLGLVITLIGKFFLTFLFPEFISAYWLLPLFALVFLGSGVQCLSNAYRSLNRADMVAKSSFLMLLTTLIFGYFLIASYSIFGLLALRILVNIFSGAFLYLNQKKVGLEIEIIPRFKDLQFFASVFKRVMKRVLHRLGL